MKRILVFACTVLFASQVFAQGLAGKWLVETLLGISLENRIKTEGDRADGASKYL